MKGGLDTNLCLHSILIYTESYVTWHIERQVVQNVYYCKYQFPLYLWWTKLARKHSKLHKYYVTEPTQILQLYFKPTESLIFSTGFRPTEILKWVSLTFVLSSKVIFSEWNRWENFLKILSCWVTQQIEIKILYLHNSLASTYQVICTFDRIVTWCHKTK